LKTDCKAKLVSRNKETMMELNLLYRWCSQCIYLEGSHIHANNLFFRILEVKFPFINI